MQNLVVVLTLGARALEVQKILGTPVPAPRDGVMAPLCYQATFDQSGSNRTSVIMEICQKKIAPSRPAFRDHLGDWK